MTIVLRRTFPTDESGALTSEGFLNLDQQSANASNQCIRCRRFLFSSKNASKSADPLTCCNCRYVFDTDPVEKQLPHRIQKLKSIFELVKENKTAAPPAWPGKNEILETTLWNSASFTTLSTQPSTTSATTTQTSTFTVPLTTEATPFSVPPTTPFVVPTIPVVKLTTTCKTDCAFFKRPTCQPNSFEQERIQEKLRKYGFTMAPRHVNNQFYSPANSFEFNPRPSQSADSIQYYQTGGPLNPDLERIYSNRRNELRSNDEFSNRMLSSPTQCQRYLANLILYHQGDIPRDPNFDKIFSSWKNEPSSGGKIQAYFSITPTQSQHHLPNSIQYYQGNNPPDLDVEIKTDKIHPRRRNKLHPSGPVQNYILNPPWLKKNRMNFVTPPAPSYVNEHPSMYNLLPQRESLYFDSTPATKMLFKNTRPILSIWQNLNLPPKAAERRVSHLKGKKALVTKRQPSSADGNNTVSFFDRKGMNLMTTMDINGAQNYPYLSAYERPQSASSNPNRRHLHSLPALSLRAAKEDPLRESLVPIWSNRNSQWSGMLLLNEMPHKKPEAMSQMPVTSNEDLSAVNSVTSCHTTFCCGKIQCVESCLPHWASNSDHIPSAVPDILGSGASTMLPAIHSPNQFEAELHDNLTNIIKVCMTMGPEKSGWPGKEVVTVPSTLLPADFKTTSVIPGSLSVPQTKVTELHPSDAVRTTTQDLSSYIPNISTKSSRSPQNLGSDSPKVIPESLETFTQIPHYFCCATLNTPPQYPSATVIDGGPFSALPSFVYERGQTTKSAIFLDTPPLMPLFSGIGSISENFPNFSASLTDVTFPSIPSSGWYTLPSIPPPEVVYPSVLSPVTTYTSVPPMKVTYAILSSPEVAHFSIPLPLPEVAKTSKFDFNLLPESPYQPPTSVPPSPTVAMPYPPILLPQINHPPIADINPSTEKARPPSYLKNPPNPFTKIIQECESISYITSFPGTTSISNTFSSTIPLARVSYQPFFNTLQPVIFETSTSDLCGSINSKMYPDFNPYVQNEPYIKYYPMQTSKNYPPDSVNSFLLQRQPLFEGKNRPMKFLTTLNLREYPWFDLVTPRIFREEKLVQAQNFHGFSNYGLSWAAPQTFSTVTPPSQSVYNAPSTYLPIGSKLFSETCAWPFFDFQHDQYNIDSTVPSVTNMYPVRVASNETLDNFTVNLLNIQNFRGSTFQSDYSQRVVPLKGKFFHAKIDNFTDPVKFVQTSAVKQINADRHETNPNQSSFTNQILTESPHSIPNLEFAESRQKSQNFDFSKPSQVTAGKSATQIKTTSINMFYNGTQNRGTDQNHQTYKTRKKQSNGHNFVSTSFFGRRSKAHMKPTTNNKTNRLIMTSKTPSTSFPSDFWQIGSTQITPKLRVIELARKLFFGSTRASSPMTPQVLRLEQSTYRSAYNGSLRLSKDPIVFSPHFENSKIIRAPTNPSPKTQSQLFVQVNRCRMTDENQTGNFLSNRPTYKHLTEMFLNETQRDRDRAEIITNSVFAVANNTQTPLQRNQLNSDRLASLVNHDDPRNVESLLKNAKENSNTLNATQQYDLYKLLSESGMKRFKRWNTLKKGEEEGNSGNVQDSYYGYYKLRSKDASNQNFFRMYSGHTKIPEMISTSKDFHKEIIGKKVRVEGRFKTDYNSRLINKYNHEFHPGFRWNNPVGNSRISNLPSSDQNLDIRHFKANLYSNEADDDLEPEKSKFFSKASKQTGSRKSYPEKRFIFDKMDGNNLSADKDKTMISRDSISKDISYPQLFDITHDLDREGRNSSESKSQTDLEKAPDHRLRSFRIDHSVALTSLDYLPEKTVFALVKEPESLRLLNGTKMEANTIFNNRSAIVGYEKCFTRPKCNDFNFRNLRRKPGICSRENQLFQLIAPKPVYSKRTESPQLTTNQKYPKYTSNSEANYGKPRLKSILTLAENGIYFPSQVSNRSSEVHVRENLKRFDLIKNQPQNIHFVHTLSSDILSLTPEEKNYDTTEADIRIQPKYRFPPVKINPSKTHFLPLTPEEKHFDHTKGGELIMQKIPQIRASSIKTHLLPWVSEEEDFGHSNANELLIQKKYNLSPVRYSLMKTHPLSRTPEEGEFDHTEESELPMQKEHSFPPFKVKLLKIYVSPLDAKQKNLGYTEEDSTPKYSLPPVKVNSGKAHVTHEGIENLNQSGPFLAWLNDGLSVHKVISNRMFFPLQKAEDKYLTETPISTQTKISEGRNLVEENVGKSVGSTTKSGLDFYPLMMGNLIRTRPKNSEFLKKFYGINSMPPYVSKNIEDNLKFKTSNRDTLSKFSELNSSFNSSKFKVWPIEGLSPLSDNLINSIQGHSNPVKLYQILSGSKSTTDKNSINTRFRPLHSVNKEWAPVENIYKFETNKAAMVGKTHLQVLSDDYSSFLAKNMGLSFLPDQKSSNCKTSYEYETLNRPSTQQIPEISLRLVAEKIGSKMNDNDLTSVETRTESTRYLPEGHTSVPVSEATGTEMDFDWSNFIEATPTKATKRLEEVEPTTQNEIGNKIYLDELDFRNAISTRPITSFLETDMITDMTGYEMQQGGPTSTKTSVKPVPIKIKNEIQFDTLTLIPTIEKSKTSWSSAAEVVLWKTGNGKFDGSNRDETMENPTSSLSKGARKTSPNRTGSTPHFRGPTLIETTAPVNATTSISESAKSIDAYLQWNKSLESIHKECRRLWPECTPNHRHIQCSRNQPVEVDLNSRPTYCRRPSLHKSGERMRELEPRNWIFNPVIGGSSKLQPEFVQTNDSEQFFEDIRLIDGFLKNGSFESFMRETNRRVDDVTGSSSNKTSPRC